jgi:DNA-binding response OmpR family regulator
LRRPQEAISNFLKVGDLTFDTVNYDVRRGKKRIKLTSTEYSLLEYMMRNVGKVLNKDKIIGHVWDFDADILPNTVEAYVGSLRRKIDKAFPGKPLIQTLRGIGYKIEG